MSTCRFLPSISYHGLVHCITNPANFLLKLVSVLQEAVSTGDPELVQLVLQYRDFKRATERLAGIPELLSKLRQVRLRGEVSINHEGDGELQVCICVFVCVRVVCHIFSPVIKMNCIACA